MNNGITEPRPLKYSWTVEAAEDLKVFHSFGVEDALTEMLEKQYVEMFEKQHGFKFT